MAADNKVRVSIVAEMTGDGISKARNELDALEKKLPGATRGVEEHGLAQRKLGDLAGGAGQRINDLAAEFTGRLGPAGAKAQQAVEGVTGGISAMPVASAAAVGGVAVLGAAMYKMGQSGVDAFLELGDKVKSFQEAAGTSAEDSSVLVDAFDDLGIGADTGAGAMARLARNVVSNRDALAAHGAEVALTKDGLYDAWGTLGNVAEAFANSKDQTDKAAIGNAAFGKSWRDLAPLLQGGRANLDEIREEAKRLGIVMSQDDVEAAHNFKMSLVDLKDSFDGTKISIGRELVPELTRFVTGLTNVSQKTDEVTHGTVNLGSAFAAVAKGAAGPAVAIISAFGNTGKAAKDVADAQTEMVETGATVVKSLDAIAGGSRATKEDVADYEKSVRQAAAAYKEYEANAMAAAKATTDMADAQNAGASVELSYESSVLGTANSLHEQTTKSEELAVAIRDHGAASEEARKAQADLDGQTIATKTSFINQADAAVILAENTANAAGQSLNASQKATIQRDEYNKLAATLDPGSPLRVYLEGLIQKLNSLPERKTVNVDINQNYRSSGVNQVGGVTVMASGGTTGTYGDVIVGERGPERLRLPAGSEVTPNHLLTGAGGGNTYNLYVESGADADEIGRAIAWHTRYAGV